MTIPYTPKAKSSVRLGRWGHHYNPSRRGMEETRRWVRKYMLENNIPIMKGPLLVVAHFRIPAPMQVTYNRRKALDNTPHTKKPDGDNLEKFLNDSLNGVLWEDDKQIAFLFRSKSVTAAKTGSTKLYVKELSDSKIDCAEIVREIQENIELDDNKHC